MERGDVYLVSLDPTAGHEQKRSRPVLVISPGKFNRLTGLPVVVPITTVGGFARTAGFAVSLKSASTRVFDGYSAPARGRQESFAVTSLALLICTRGAKKLEAVPDHIVDEVLSKVSPLFE